MENLKETVLSVISKLPESVDMEEIMYRLYVLDKIRKGQAASKRGEVISIEDLEKEIQVW